MSATDALNKPVSVTLAGKRVKVRQVPTIQIFAFGEEYIKQQRVDKIQAMAALLNGPEKLEFITAQMENIPEGTELEKLGRQMFIDGDPPLAVACKIIHAAMLQDQPKITIEEATELVIQSTTDEEMLATRLANGTAGKGTAPARKTSSGSSKKKTGRQK